MQDYNIYKIVTMLLDVLLPVITEAKKLENKTHGSKITMEYEENDQFSVAVFN